jgi:hypothetical protein
VQQLHNRHINVHPKTKLFEKLRRTWCMRVCECACTCTLYGFQLGN